MSVTQTVLRGLAASRGVASGPLFVVEERADPTGAAATDYQSAVDRVVRRLEEVAAMLPASRSDGAAILRAQAAMARDPGLASAAGELVARGQSPGGAVKAAASAYAERLAALSDAHLGERAADVREVGRLLAAEIAGSSSAPRLANLGRPSVVVARELSPLDTLSVPSGLLLAIVTEEGGLTSHAAIVARELGIPAVVGARSAVAMATGHAGAVVDGGSGEVRFSERVEEHAAGTGGGWLDVSGAPVEMMANVGSVQAALAAARRGAAGIGLFRTEFMFMSERGPMNEGQQLAVYEAACEAMATHAVVVRTLDAGADKPLPYLPASREPNPQLGRRGVRLWLGVDDLWRPQVRALVRAGRGHPNLKVMLPMVASRSEMVAAHERFQLIASELGAPVPSLGMMVEVPAVAAALRAFAGVADFISLGTNDLTQYTVAADRGLDWGEDLGEFNPGVLRLIATAVADARMMGIPAGVCGELAGRPEGAIFLVGAGVSSLSMTVDAVPAVLGVTRRLGRAACERAAQAALAAVDARSAVEGLLALAQA